MPKTVLVANSKGGVGKTTIASELAFAAQNSGLKFDYYDLDRQGGSSFEDRQDPDSVVAIVDTPGALTEDLGKYIRSSDLIVVPTRMSYRDQQPLELMIRTIRDAGIPAIYVLSQWNRYRVCADFLDWFKGAYPTETVIALPQSELFPQAGLAGRSVCQMNLSSFPAQQVNQLIGMVEMELQVGFRLWGREVNHG